MPLISATTTVPDPGAGREDAMQDVWYDLVILEMSDLSDPAKEKLVEAEQLALPEPEPEEIAA